jgi:YidC/Oxa1 family membrane protein insertase
MIKNICKWAGLIVYVIYSTHAVASIPDETSHQLSLDALQSNPTEFLQQKVQENYAFFGMSVYFNNLDYYLIDTEQIRRIEEAEIITLQAQQWLAVVGRFRVMLIQADSLIFSVNNQSLKWQNPAVLAQDQSQLMLVAKNELSAISPELNQIRYAHLWWPLAGLSRAVEAALVFIQQYLVSNWGWTIVLFSVLVRLLLLPVGILTTRSQRKVSQVQALLAPRLLEIKANFDGETAHNKIMAAHKDLGVSPFYTLKPMLATMIQLPILIAVFNALGVMSQFEGQSFLWITDLAYPDTIGNLSSAIPMLGSSISLLPVVMTIVTLLSTISFQNSHAPELELQRQKRNLYLMAAAFFILFYPFPAAMVLYWTAANILTGLQQYAIKI